MPDSVRPQASTWTARRVRLSGSSVALVLLVLVAVVVVAGLVSAASQPLGWIAAAVVTALVLAPVVEVQARWIPRGLAILSTVLVGVAVVASIGVGALLEVQDQLAQLEEALPAAAAEIEERQGEDSVAGRLGLASLVQDLVDEMSDRVAPDPTIDDAVGTVPAYFVSAVLVVFFLVWGGAMLDGARRQIADPERRERVSTTVSLAAAWTQRYVVTVLVMAALIAAVGTGLAWWAGTSIPLVLGVVLGVASIVPYVGVLAGGLPMLVLVAALESAGTTALVAAGLVAIQAAATVALRTVVEGRSFRAGPAVIVVAALIGSDVYGIGGALVAVIAGLMAMATIESWSRLEGEDDPGVRPGPTADPEG